MTRRTNLKGFRLGTSNFWNNQLVSLKYSELFTIQLFIEKIIKGFFSKWDLGLLFLDIQIKGSKININLIIHDKFWSDLRTKKRRKKRFTKKKKLNYLKLLQYRKIVLNNFFFNQKIKKVEKKFPILQNAFYRSYYNSVFLVKYLQKNNLLFISTDTYNQLLTLVLKKKKLITNFNKAILNYRKTKKTSFSFFTNRFFSSYPFVNFLNINSTFFFKFIKIYLERFLFIKLKGKYLITIDITSTKSVLKSRPNILETTNLIINLPQFHKYTKMYKENFFEYVLILNLAFYFQNASFIAEFISFLLKNNRRHKNICLMVFNLIEVTREFYTQIQTVKLQVAGRFQNNKRKAKLVLQTSNALKSQMISQELKYGFSEAYTYCGSFGIKIWMLKSNKSYKFL